MARVLIKPVEPLEIQFADGTVKEALFNNEAFINFTHEFGAIDDLIETELKDRPYDFGAKILYCGMKVVDKRITLDEARAILMCGGEELLMEVTRLIIDNFMMSANEGSKKNFDKLMEQYMEKIQR